MTHFITYSTCTSALFRRILSCEYSRSSVRFSALTSLSRSLCLMAVSPVSLSLCCKLLTSPARLLPPCVEEHKLMDSSNVYTLAGTHMYSILAYCTQHSFIRLLSNKEHTNTSTFNATTCTVSRTLKNFVLT